MLQCNLLLALHVAVLPVLNRAEELTTVVLIVVKGRLKIVLPVLVGPLDLFFVRLAIIVVLLPALGPPKYGFSHSVLPQLVQPHLRFLVYPIVLRDLALLVQQSQIIELPALVGVYFPHLLAGAIYMLEARGYQGCD